MPAHFPTRRRDGTFSVGVLFTVTNPAAIPAIEDYVRDWARSNSGPEKGLLRELSVAPEVTDDGKSAVMVIFHGRPDSVRWKDWMVSLVQQMTAALGEVTFGGVVDMVAD